MDSFQVSTTLLELLDKGAIKRKEEAEKEEEEKKAAKKKRPVQIKGLKYILTILMLAALAVSVASVLFYTEYHLQEFMASERIDALRLSIEAQRHDKGTYPSSVEGIDPWGNPYIYTAGEDAFTLFSAGPDGVPNTPDDIY
jgi:cell division protein FtsL